jgi:hypothetical protein
VIVVTHKQVNVHLLKVNALVIIKLFVSCRLVIYKPNVCSFEDTFVTAFEDHMNYLFGFCEI